jgi:hypothetical protein
MKYFNEFHQLEVDLLSYPAKPRPLSSGDQVTAKVEAIHGPKIEDGCKTAVANLKELFKPLNKEDKGQVQLREFWPLNPRGCVDWRDGNSLQNSTREWVKFCIFARVEMDITSTYRSKLLKGSHAASFLRSTFKKTMDPFCGERKVKFLEGETKSAMLTGWYYPDPYRTSDQSTPPVVDLDNIIITREARRIEAEGRKTLTNFLAKAQAMKIFTASLTSGYMDDDIGAAFKVLENVSTHISYIAKPFLTILLLGLAH